MGRIYKNIFDFLASLKLAVGVIVALTLALATATMIESYYDTPTAQYYVYQSLWFYAIMGMLALNILVVAISRWPWKKRHIPFLLAHLGIEMVILGSWITQHYGLDGNLRLNEGETGSVVEIDRPVLQISDITSVRSMPVPWIPPGVAFKPIALNRRGLAYDLTIDQYISRAEPQYNFIADPRAYPHEPTEASSLPMAPSQALHLQIQGGPMRITQDMWLWAGDPSFRAIQMGPAWFAISDSIEHEPRHRENQPGVVFAPKSDGSVEWLARTSDGKHSQGVLKAGAVESAELHPGWKGDVKLTVLKSIPRAVPLVTYQPSRIQFGPQAPPSAIHLIAGKGGEGNEAWLGLGDRALLRVEGREIQVGYFPKRVILPFAIRLDRFTIDHNPGTDDPAAYSSKVTVIDQKPMPQQLISMNEPLHYRGLTIYQASYENPVPPPDMGEDRKQASADSLRPTVSIFSVNQDPGRLWKYYGSLLIVLGSILLFAMKYWKAKPSSARQRT